MAKSHKTCMEQAEIIDTFGTYHEPYEFNFSKFSKQPRGTDLSSNDKIIEEIASIVIPPNDTL